MSPKKKKLYTILIISTLVFSAGMLGWSQFGVGGGPKFPDPALTINQTPTQVGGDVITGYSAPAVFPSTNEFRTEVLGSSAFMKLHAYQPVSPEGPFGRLDPFSSY